MISPTSLTGGLQLSPEWVLAEYPLVMKIVFATALGMLLGIEREWSEKPAGLRTFTIITLAATVLTIADEPILLVLGGVLVIFQGSVFALRGLFGEADTYLLTTATSMILAYGIGVLIGKGQFQIATIVAIVTSLVLVLRRELHGFARNLSKDEIQSALELGILAFVIYPLLPTRSFGPSGAIAPRTIWLLVVAVSAIGFANYLVVQRYGAKGIAITSFFGGLVNSAAVIGEIVSRTRQRPDLSQIAVGGILLANAAMAFRDMLIAVAFIPDLIFDLGIPLVTISVTGVALSYLYSDWNIDLEIEFDSPFNLETALKFGALFLIVLVVSATAQTVLGNVGFLVSSFFSGMVSSGAVTTTVVLLFKSGQITKQVATAGIIIGVSASILVKLGLVMSMDRSMTRPVAYATASLLGVGLVAAGLTIVLIP